MEDQVFSNKYVIGEKVEQAYSVTHLLTQLTNINYVDLTGNGPSDDDFGGWTKFDYKRWSSENHRDWYHYRTPYKGLLFNEGDFSTNDDDLGTVSYGDKQVYYMKGIETKTHYAFFITNKSTPSDYESLPFMQEIYNLPEDDLKRQTVMEYLTGTLRSNNVETISVVLIKIYGAVAIMCLLGVFPRKLLCY